jgi:hypothetical protein
MEYSLTKTATIEATLPVNPRRWYEDVGKGHDNRRLLRLTLLTSPGNEGESCGLLVERNGWDIERGHAKSDEWVMMITAEKFDDLATQALDAFQCYEPDHMEVALLTALFTNGLPSFDTSVILRHLALRSAEFKAREARHRESLAKANAAKGAAV